MKLIKSKETLETIKELNNCWDFDNDCVRDEPHWFDPTLDWSNKEMITKIIGVNQGIVFNNTINQLKQIRQEYIDNNIAVEW